MESSSSSRPLPSLSLSLRRLMSLDAPRVALGRRCDVVKEEPSEDPMPLAPPVSIIEVKAKKKSNDDPPPSRRFCCVLCTSRPGDDHLEEFCSADPRRLCHLRSLLGISVEDLVFCSVCRHAVNRLFTLREEVSEIESRIRAVGTLRGPITSIQVKVEDVESASSDSTSTIPVNEVVCVRDEDIMLSFGIHAPTTTTPISKDQPGMDEGEAEEPSCDLGEATEGPIALKSSGTRGKGKNQTRLKKAMNVEVATRQRMSSMKKRRHIYRCLVCKKGFHSNEIYKSHSHPDERDPSKVSYTCQLCQKSFERTRTLRNHKRVVRLKHTQKVCGHCGKRFQTKYNLRHHNITCNPQNREGERKCHCGKVFTTNAEILAHERVVHKGLDSIKCYFCTQMCSTAALLVLHMRIHTLERPYLCGKCGKDFTQGRSLWRHMASVCGSDEKKKEEIRRLRRKNLKLRRAKLLYRCDLCDIGFAEKKSLVRHQRRKHK